MHVKQRQPGVVYLDTENNSILNEADWQAVEHYNYSKSLFIYMNQAPFLDAVYTLREKSDTMVQ